jgi:hypothetical protein
MTEKQYSSAKVQYECFNATMKKLSDELNKGLASFFLMLPVGIPYETWRWLHIMKGDYE